jgi:hypothetical protein
VGDLPGGGGGVDTANTPNANEFARFTDADTIEGRTAAETRADLDLEVGVDLARWLTRVTAALTTGNLTATVNGHHVLTISDMTAARSFVIPAGTAEGDLISWECITGAPATAGYEMVLIGDTGVTLVLGGTDRAATADASFRYLIAGENGVLRWDATASKWRLIVDGRIRQKCRIGLVTSVTNHFAESFTYYVVPADATQYDNANMASLADDTITARRTNQYLLQSSFVSSDAVSDQDGVAAKITKASGATTIVARSFSAAKAAAYLPYATIDAIAQLTNGDVIRSEGRYGQFGGGTLNLDAAGGTGGSLCYLSLLEVF